MEIIAQTEDQAPLSPDTPGVSDNQEGAAETRPQGHRVQWRQLTPAVAKHLLTQCRYERQRPTRDAHIQDLAAAMLAGRYEPCGIKLMRCEGRTVMTDGYHRCHGAIISKAAPWEYFSVRDAASWEEVHSAYSRIDMPLQRSMHDRLVGRGLAEQLGLSPWQIDRASGAVRILASGFAAAQLQTKSGPCRDVDSREEMVRRWKDEIALYFDWVRVAHPTLRTPLRLCAAIAVGLPIARWHPEKGSEFYRRVASLDGLPADGPELQMALFLQSQRVAGHGVAVYCRGLVAPWNVWFDGKGKARLREEEKAAPIRIAGTPFDGVRQIAGWDLPPRGH